MDDQKVVVTAPCVLFAFEHVSIPQTHSPAYDDIFQPKKGPNQKEKLHFINQLSQYRQNLAHVLVESTIGDVHIQAAGNFLSLLVHTMDQCRNNDTVHVKRQGATWTSALHIQHTEMHRSEDGEYDVSMAYLTLAFLLSNKAYAAIHNNAIAVDEALKSACHLMRQAAGVVQALQTNVTSKWTNIAIGRTTDVVPSTVDALISMFMGEAHQLAIWKGNLTGSLSTGSLVKLHQTTYRMYEKAEEKLRSLHEVDRSRLDPGLKQFIHNQLFLNRALMYKYLSMGAYTEGKYGLAVGFMRRAKASSPKIFPTPVTRLTTLRAHVEAELKVINELLVRYEHENSTIYYAAIPAEDQLTLPEGKPLFEPIPYTIPAIPTKFVDLRSAP